MQNMEQVALKEALESLRKDCSHLEEQLQKLEDEKRSDIVELEIDNQDRKLHSMEEQLEEMSDMYQSDESLQELTQITKTLREKLTKIVKNYNRSINSFDLEKGLYINIQFCNGHVIHADCLERYLYFFK